MKNFRRFIDSFGMGFIFLLLCIFFWIKVDLLNPTTVFLTQHNFSNILLQSSVNIIIATGMTFVICAAEIDLSAGSLLAFCGMITALLLKVDPETGMNVPMQAAYTFQSWLPGFIQGSNTVTVTQEDGSVIEIPCDKLILALGSRPLSIPSFPFDGVRIISSNEALNLQKLPASLLIVGGGVIGCEFAFIFSSLGSKVTLVEGLSRILPLPSVDRDCSKILQREMKKRHINFMVDRTVESFEKAKDKLRINVGPSPFLPESQKGDVKTSTVEVEQVLVCIGRRPNTANVGLENIGVRTDDHGWIIVDERMETNKPGVYAIGDVLGPLKVMLAHVASTEGLVAAENAVGGNRTMDYSVVPGAIFTMPEVANVGLTETQAKEQGYNVRSDSVLFRTLGKAHVIGEIAGQAKIVSDAGNGKIFGVHIVGPRATDLIAEAALAIQMGGRVQDLAATIHAHPTLAEIMMETSFKALGRALHG